ncbi:MAG: hypothetical protein GY830_10165 [Bacteroidetes bacterium]|nr:hypothetical protein [Bacteroidota bacterium]
MFLVKIIPKDPSFVPNKTQILILKKLLEKIYDEIKITVFDNIIFHDCGQNFEKVFCNHCHIEINDFWQEKMNQDYCDIAGFKLNNFITPCCNKKSNLNLLKYEKDQGFSKFMIEIIEPDSLISVCKQTKL